MKKKLIIRIIVLCTYCLQPAYAQNPTTNQESRISAEISIRLEKGTINLQNIKNENPEGYFTCFISNLKLRITNTSTRDIKIALQPESLRAVDDNGTNILGERLDQLQISGISSQRIRENNEFLSKASTIYSGQSIAVQIGHTKHGIQNNCTRDENRRFYNDYKPTSFSLSGFLLIENTDTATYNKAGFSLTDTQLIYFKN